MKLFQLIKEDKNTLNHKIELAIIVLPTIFIGLVALEIITINFPFLVCKFKDYTGFSCFGCGLTRSTRAFFHFRFLESLYYNPFVLITVPIITLRIYQKISVLFFRRYYSINLKISYCVYLYISLVIFYGGMRLVLELLGVITPL